MSTSNTISIASQEDVVSLMRLQYELGLSNIEPIGNNIISDVKCTDSNNYLKSKVIYGFQFFTRMGVLYQNMVSRCRSNNAYIDVTVCKQWMDEKEGFNNFAAFVTTQFNYYHKDEKGNFLNLDKDLLGNGSNLYSPETCCFLPQAINIAINGKGSYGFTATKGKYRAQLAKYGKTQSIGTYNTAKEANKAYKKERKSYLKELAKSNKHLLTQQAYKELLNFKP